MSNAPFLRPPLALTAVLVVASAPFAHAPAEAQQPSARDKKRACVESYEQAQQLRNVGKLTESRERLLVCSSDECPTAVRGDCANWLAEVESNLPSVVIEARLPMGRETADVNVWVDGQVFARGLDGRALTVDPGVHTFRFESASAGKSEQQVIIRQGEKNRKIVVQFGSGSPGPAPAEITPSTPLPKTETPKASSGGSALYPVLPLVLVGVGVAGVGTFAGFALSGKQLERDLRDKCAPSCSESQVNGVKQRYLYADVAMTVGVASLLGGALTYFLLKDDRPSSSSGARLQFDIGAAPGGGVAGLSGRF
jgi:hypothetical protein